MDRARASQRRCYFGVGPASKTASLWLHTFCTSSLLKVRPLPEVSDMVKGVQLADAVAVV